MLCPGRSHPRPAVQGPIPETSAPTSVEGIERYLASGMIRGIGPVYARKLLRVFGEKVFDVIEAQPDRLCPETQRGKIGIHCGLPTEDLLPLAAAHRVCRSYRYRTARRADLDHCPHGGCLLDNQTTLKLESTNCLLRF
jgi:hypothetical protein